MNQSTVKIMFESTVVIIIVMKQNKTIKIIFFTIFNNFSLIISHIIYGISLYGSTLIKMFNAILIHQKKTICIFIKTKLD